MEEENKLSSADYAERDAQVAEMIACGMSESDIAQYLRIAQETLQQDHGDIVEQSAVEAKFKILKSLFEMARNGRNASATTFWVRARCGWNQSRATDKTDPDDEGPPPEFHVFLNDGAPNYEG